MGLTLPSGRIEDLDTPDAQVAFIRSQWRDFAAFAWRKYVSEGRGAIVVDLRNASKSPEGLQVPTYYVGEGTERLAKRGGWPNEDVADVIREYDPEQDIVLIFLRLDGDVSYYNVSDELTPPRAYETRQEADESRDERLSSNEPLTSN
ncbi:MAG: hypothetical protein AABN33_03850 [Acidobacteriota bacterium]